MLTFFAILPLVIFFSAILFFRQSVLNSALLSIFTLFFIGLSLWQINPWRIFSAGGKGVLIAIEIALIIFGAILILEMLKKRGLIDFLKNFFEKVSFDRRIHVILIGWCLIYFLEGIAGFGTPAIIAVPIFLALGFKPIPAVVISLLGDSVPVIFGAVGLPVIYGIGSILSGLNSFGAPTIQELGIYIAGLNLIGNLLMPVLILYIFCKLEKHPFSQFKEFIPFALSIGAVTGSVSFLTAKFIGPELPSIMGGIAGVIAVLIMAKWKILLPKIEEEERLTKPDFLPNKIANTLRALTPYLFVFILLLLSRLPTLPFREFLMSNGVFELKTLFDFEINYLFQPLYAVGILMIISGLLSYPFLKFNIKEGLEILKSAGKKVFHPFLALSAVLIFVQIYLYSGENLSGLPSMLALFAKSASDFFGGFWPFIAPAIGALGAATSGSATVSNLIFSDIQYQIALSGGFVPILILALQGLGASAGNMIALHNIITALAVTNLSGKENQILQKILPILIFYLAILGLFGLSLSLLF